MREAETDIVLIMSVGMSARDVSMQRLVPTPLFELQQSGLIVMRLTVSGLAVDTLLKKLYRALKAV
jgi:hypothetical protein